MGGTSSCNGSTSVPLDGVEQVLHEPAPLVVAANLDRQDRGTHAGPTGGVPVRNHGPGHDVGAQGVRAVSLGAAELWRSLRLELEYRRQASARRGLLLLLRLLHPRSRRQPHDALHRPHVRLQPVVAHQGGVARAEYGLQVLERLEGVGRGAGQGENRAVHVAARCGLDDEGGRVAVLGGEHDARGGARRLVFRGIGRLACLLPPLVPSGGLPFRFVVSRDGGKMRKDET